MIRYGVSVAALLAPALALASGYETEYPDNGGKALGRAGAFLVKADDPTAIYYNPAGLTKQSGFNLLISANAISLTHRFRPADDVLGRSTRQFGPLDQDESLFVAPMIAAHFDFEALPDFDFGVGIYGPAAQGKRKFPNQYPITGATNSSGNPRTLQANQTLVPNGLIWDNNIVLAFPTVSVAWKAHETLSLGVSLQAVYFDAQLNTAMGGPAPALIELDVNDPFTPTATFGATYAPTPSVELGLSVRPPVEIAASGTATFSRFNARDADDESLAPLGTEGDIPLLNEDGSKNHNIDFTFNHPLVVRTGARYVQPDFDIEINYIYQRQSVHEAYEVRFKAARAELPVEGGDPIVIAPVPEIDDLRKYEDTHGIRLGGDYSVTDMLTVRGGYTWEQGASPDAYTHLDFPGLDQQSIHAGVGLSFEMVDIDVGYGLVLLEERTVTESDVRLIDVTLPRDKWSVVGNGTFSGHYHIVGLSTNWHL